MYVRGSLYVTLYDTFCFRCVYKTLTRLVFFCYLPYKMPCTNWGSALSSLCNQKLPNRSFCCLLLQLVTFVRWHKRKPNWTWAYLKLVSAIFYQIFIFNQIIGLQKVWKVFFISSKKLFSFSRYSNFCISVFSLFCSLSAIAL